LLLIRWVLGDLSIDLLQRFLAQHVVLIFRIACRFLFAAVAPSAIDLAEHDIHRADDGDHVRNHVSAGDVIHRSEVGKTRRA